MTLELPFLAPPQRRMWFLERLAPGRSEANLFNGFRIEGELDPKLWEAAVRQTVADNAVLRTRFAEVSGAEARQITDASCSESGVVWETLAGASRAEQENEWAARVPDFVRRAFSLGQLPLFRMHLARVGAKEHFLFLVMHHIISDGDLSAELFLRQILKRYGSKAAPTVAAPFTVAPVQAPSREDLAFWQDYLDDAPQEISLPRSADPRATRQSATLFEIPAALVSQLSELATQEAATSFDLLLSAFGLLLKGHSRQEEILIGWPSPGRAGRETEIGYFGNPLPIRFNAPEGQSARHLIAATHRSVESARAHAQTPFEEIVQAMAGQGSARRPLFQTMFDLLPASDPIEGGGLSLQPVWWDGQSTDYEWSLFLQEERSGGIRARLEFRQENYAPGEMEEVAKRYLLLLEQIARTPEASAFSLLTPLDRERLARFSVGDRAEISGHCAHELFEEQVRKTPDAIAVEFQGETRSYRELNENANRLARYLVSQGIGPEIVVALCIERSLIAVTTLLAIWKAGGAFLPLDPAYPPERLVFMLQDSRAKILLTQAKFLTTLSVDKQCRVLQCEEAMQLAQGNSPENLGLKTTHDQLNYIIYTSGSTGVPKGIAMVHRCLVNLVEWQLRHSAMRAELRVLQFASLNFDICFQEMFTTWAMGGSVILIDEITRRDPVALLDYLCRHRVNRLFLPFVALQQLALASQGRSQFPGELKEVYTAGEQLRTTPALRAFFQRIPACSLHNQYGPSEAHVITNHNLARDPETWPPLPPVGKPWLNTRIFLVDAQLQQVPPGSPGEVLVGGAGLARGYMHRPEVTAEKFIRDRFGDDPTAMLYRTGDLARALPDGSLEFLRRIDFQVKVRGFRIELGEVEAVIGQCPEVRETVVLALGEAARTQLAAYVVPQTSAGVVTRVESEQVSNWQTLWEDTYRNATDSDFNLAGWTSSYTGAPLPEEDMREWRDQTVERILALKPRRVLEIGCGAGLLLARVAPSCEFYAGTDFSAEIIERLASRVKTDPALASRVSVRQAEALDLDAWAGQRFDTVILNSVLQLFPSGDYLERVLAKAARLVGPGGRIFVGDVQNLDLLEAYHAGVQLHRSPGSARMKEIVRNWRQAFVREDQLMVAPGFFASLSGKVPGIGAVRLDLKRGSRSNELLKFRYDVVLELAPIPNAAPGAALLEVDSIEAAERSLKADPAIPVRARGLRNARVSFDQHLLELTDSRMTKTEVLASFADDGAVDPERCWALADRFAVHCSLVWSREAACFDALWSNDPNRHLEVVVGGRAPFTNDPAAGNRHRAFAAYLRSYLEKRLPEYMVPNHLIILEALPVKTNGKVDRAELPRPEYSHSGSETNWVAPKTQTEIDLAALWEETLGVNQAGTSDDFFAQGGHSLLAVQLLYGIRQRFGVEIPLVALFEERTLGQLARRIEAAQKSSAPLADAGLVDEGVL